MRKVLVTGARGQLGKCLLDLMRQQKELITVATDLEELDITDYAAVMTRFKEEGFQFCVNCAAYTAVDKAETESELAESINAQAVKNLAQACLETNCKLIHVSTDFIFDGLSSQPYTEEDIPNPVNVYGASKLAGERVLRELLTQYFIIRTSWVYSEYGINFLKTMLKLGQEREELKVVADQVGTPTYAGDLAAFIVKIIAEDLSSYGVYHYSNEGVASWFDFARSIFELSGIHCDVIPIPAESYPTAAIRPSYSVLDKSKVKETFKIAVPYWRDSLKLATDRLLKNQGE